MARLCVIALSIVGTRGFIAAPRILRTRGVLTNAGSRSEELVGRRDFLNAGYFAAALAFASQQASAETVAPSGVLGIDSAPLFCLDQLFMPSQ